MDKTIDLLFLDDEETILELLGERANRLGLICKSFTRGEDALTYLMTADDIPYGGFSDMRLPDSSGHLEEGSIESLAPEQIGYIFSESEIWNNFRFITGHISERDRLVGERTGCKILWKNGLFFWPKVESIMNSVYVQKLIDVHFPKIEPEDGESFKFPIDTLHEFNKRLANLPMDCLEKACDSLVESGYLNGVVIHEGNKYYELRSPQKDNNL